MPVTVSEQESVDRIPFLISNQDIRDLRNCIDIETARHIMARYPACAKDMNTPLGRAWHTILTAYRETLVLESRRYALFEAQDSELHPFLPD